MKDEGEGGVSVDFQVSVLGDYVQQTKQGNMGGGANRGTEDVLRLGLVDSE